MNCTKGIILAGGTGSRLHPLTIAANKQLLPIYDKPVVYYPLTTLMLGGIREILIISTPKDLSSLENLLGSGEQLGMKISYILQEEPRGLPDAFILGERFIDQSPVAMILGDNFFHGHGLTDLAFEAAQKVNGARIFAYSVEDPSRYGIVTLNDRGIPVELTEKPKNPKSHFAVTGLYFFDGDVSHRAKNLKPSQRGELEIVDLIRTYMDEERLSVTQLGRGYVWFDVGTPESLLSASNYVEVIQSRQGIIIASPEEVAWRMKFINDKAFKDQVTSLPRSTYRKYLETLLEL